MKKYLLSMLLITAVFANFDDRKGEDISTELGIIHRSRTKLKLIETDGTVHDMDRSNRLIFKRDHVLSGCVLKKRLELTHAMSRAELLAALMDYTE
jgi:hypothetical protein